MPGQWRAVNDPVSAPDAAASVADSDARGRPFACRLIQRVKVLYVDDGKGVAYLQMTPYQSHTIWALQAAGVQMWGERYGATSDELPSMDRLDASQIIADRLTMSLTDTLKLYDPQGFGGAIPTQGGAIPGENSAIPGQQSVPRQQQPMVAPTAAPVTKP